MQRTYYDGDHVRLSSNPSGDIPEELRGVEVDLIIRVAYSRRPSSDLYSAKTATGEIWVVRGDWIDDETDDLAS